MPSSSQKPDKLYMLSNGDRAVPEKQHLEAINKNKGVIKDLVNRLSSAITSRSKLFSYLGKSFSGDRNLYTICGYPLYLDFKDYKARYDRHDLSKAIVDRPINSSWRKKPKIQDSEEDEESVFEDEVETIVKEQKVYSYLKRADTLSCLGRFSIVLLGFNDGGDLSKPVKKNSNLKLVYLSVFSEGSTEITKWETDPKNERYSLPVIYKLTTSMGDGVSSQRGIPVHYSRVIHIVPEALESDVYGIPSLEVVYNRLQDLETISAGSAEMFWKGARPGYVLSAQEDYTFDDAAKAALADELDEYEHELRRFIKLQGLEVKDLKVQALDPTKFLEAQIDLIAAAKNIPKRILMGSERGELASSQDKNNWNERMESRREDHIEPIIIRPFFDRLIELEILPSPKEEEYILEWPEFETPGEESIVKNAELATKAIAQYAMTPGIELVMPLVEFLMRFFGYTKKEAEEMSKEYYEKVEEENEEIEEDKELQRELMKKKISDGGNNNDNSNNNKGEKDND